MVCTELGCIYADTLLSNRQHIINYTAHDCGQPLPIDNGYQFGPTTTKYNGLVYYTCNPGSVLNGSSVIYCKATGWEAQPSCLGKLSNEPAPYSRGGGGCQICANELLKVSNFVKGLQLDHTLTS